MRTKYKPNVPLYLLVGLATIAFVFSFSAIFEVQREAMGIGRRGQTSLSITGVKLKDGGMGYTFSYPANYAVERPTANFKALTIRKGMIGKLEIFRLKDFGGERPWGFEPSDEDKNISAAEQQLYLDNYVPKEQLKVGPKSNQYDVWLYYNTNDLQTKNELHDIANSIHL